MAKMLEQTEATVANWLDGKKPFDFMRCGHCITAHRVGNCCKKHPQITRAVKKLFPAPICVTTIWLQDNFQTFVDLRKKFSRFYPKP